MKNFVSKIKFLSTLVVIALSNPVFAADNYKLDDAHTAVVWQVNHFGFSNPSGKFMNIEGVLVLDEENPGNSTLNVNIPVSKIESGVPKLDEHLKGKDFFDVEQFPTANFTSTKIEVTGKNTAKVTGALSLHGVTKPVVLDVTLNKIGEHPMTKKKTLGFSASTNIKRSDFGMTMGIPAVSDEVKLTIESEANIVE